jgi:two-component system NtrC family sensor kinase
MLHQEVKRRLSDLESLVAVRTRELLGANDTLRAEISRRKEVEDQLVEAQKLEGLGQLAAGIAHEINNPMAFVTSNIECLEEDIRKVRNLPAELQEYVDDILPATLDGIERVNAIVADVRRFARSGLEAPVAFDLNTEVSAALRIAACRATKKHVIDARLGPIAQLEGRPTHMGQLVINLVVNSIQAMPDGGKIEVVTCESEGHAVLEVRDDGPGMSEEVRRKLFEPFFTTKPPGQGTGLGLAVCHGIVSSHGGRIEVETVPGRGTCFRIHLPMRAAPELTEIQLLAKVA